MIRLHNENMLNAIPKSLPVLFVYGGQDPCGDYGVSVRKVYEQYRLLGIRDVSEIEYPEDRHEILNELDREKVYVDIYNWIKDRM